MDGAMTQLTIVKMCGTILLLLSKNTISIPVQDMRQILRTLH